ncbi:hypothetical protein KAFR_0F03590 [Kazachstania africana CBS 2517]|uniref:Homologous-pairing protein 2 winged helix domain-containing protein n=1 Tax=Kazachstania africana (strain ATCC 22294 / BCRC 22015 / CBS 2517 / CECT 1963 / NBRC 1671 / NRRL Y-8276) TaxID=1071382 RepID=H2AX55_KAZAF|nr:hypothetical protein KAFR_0F03590 [Kazachstania africana CBS 2517]CCF58955.1 hypothetical protein KAFR_0F03590 [Kazachstania africana CBS 2517]
MPPKRKVVQVKGDEAEDIIEQYLKTQFKPFAINDIVQNLHNKVSKSVTLKALDSLVASEKIMSRTFGKVIIYSCKDIELAEPIDDGDYSLEKLRQLQDEVMELDRDNSNIIDVINDTIKLPPNDELIESVTTLQNKIEDDKIKLKDLQANDDLKENSEVKEILELEAITEKKIIRRKKILKELMNIIKDQIRPKNLLEYLEDIGCEGMETCF